jgi:hypothetical protein
MRREDICSAWRASADPLVERSKDALSEPVLSAVDRDNNCIECAGASRKPLADLLRQPRRLFRIYAGDVEH